MKRLRYALAIAVWSAAVQPVRSQPSLEQLYENAQWFDLRDAVQDQKASAFYRAAVASAFNRPAEAERELNRAIRESPDATAANLITEELFNLYMRGGRYADALQLADEVLTLSPERADVMNLRLLLASAGATNQRVTSSRRASFACVTGGEGVSLPLSVNGQTVNWALDTGFNLPGLSEAEALMLGLAVHDVTGEATDGAGGSTTIRVAVADRVTIGETEVRHVLMGVFPDTQPPWNEWQPGQRGLIGLPLALALQSIHWTSSGACETGGRRSPVRDAESNMAFDGMAPVIRATSEGRPLSFYLDTGNMRQSQLWSRFANDFPDLVAQQGTRGRVALNQIGGSTEHEVVALPEVRLRVGGFDTLLRPANIFSPPVGNARAHGNLGLDLLRQASEVTIDFRSMTVTLR